MKLLIDAGNTRLKWRIQERGCVLWEGIGAFGGGQLNFPDSGAFKTKIARVAISTVADEGRRLRLLDELGQWTGAPVNFYWAESQRGGLKNAYSDAERMGADRWHAMYGAWQRYRRGFVVIDAGSATTIDYVDAGGVHLGGYILPGLQMMLRSLRTDAARIGFDPQQVLDVNPGATTGECGHHGLSWLSAALIERVHQDSVRLGIPDILVAGGDGPRLLDLGLQGIHCPHLVLEGLAAVDDEGFPE